ncbi:MAG TPA: thiamine phosphate synthase [Candidatus Omnitrophota bacterium]|nr:thiamine phosphate synthase [Candidatus Omnitrophota bacterium]
MLRRLRGYYFITDACLSRQGNYADVKAAVRAGTGVIQYRNKNVSCQQFFQEALILRELCLESLFIVNDRIDVAYCIDADGVHIGQSDASLSQARNLLGPKKIIGVTVRTLAQALNAQKRGASYVALGPIFATGTKHDAGLPCGVTRISEIKKRLSIPLVVIGGITLSNASEVIAAGADSVCAISAVVASANVGVSIKRFQSFFTPLGWKTG